MPRRKREEPIRALLTSAFRESVKQLIVPVRIVVETTLIYLLFLLGDFLVLGATKLAFGPGTPFIASLREGVEVLSAIALAIGYVFHVISSFRHQMQLSKLESQSDLVVQNARLGRLDEQYRHKIRDVDDVLMQLRQHRLRNTER